jgi:phosphoglycerate kinase
VVLECRDGQVILLENLRFHEGEIRNDDKFAKQLASMGEIYVNEAFATTHRGYASNVGVVKYLHTKAAGFLLAKELASLGRLMGDVRRPYVAVLGGAKASDKFDVIESLLQRVDTFVMGGAVANTFIAATGGDVGASLVEEDKLPIARNLLARAEIQGVRILLPRDFVVADSQEATQTETAQADQVPQGMMVLDIGPESRARYKEALSRAATVFWNGPMGVFEKAAFAEGTLAVAKAIAGTAAFSVVGGDDTAAAVHRFGLERGFDHISEGDGASLKMIEGKTLPGIVALA